MDIQLFLFFLLAFCWPPAVLASTAAGKAKFIGLYQAAASCKGIAIAKLVLMGMIILQLVAVDAAVNVSREEYLKLKAQLKSLNKPALMSIKTAYGDVFDCVDIYKQPAFDHPSLKDHKIQMRPTSFPKKVESNKTSYDETAMHVNVGGCPQGTVPIRRIRMQDLLRSRSPSRFGRKAVVQGDPRQGHEWATVGPPSGEYYGTQVSLNVWSPSLADLSQFSLGQLWVSSGEIGTLNTVEAGWMVYPGFFGGNFPRLFVYWTADDYRKTGCYNTLCPGFVQVSSEIAPGGAFQRVSSYNGQQVTVTLQVFKDVKTGNWWLTYGDNNKKAVGYWPKSLFNLLTDKASNVQWGGEVLKGRAAKQPQMGSGHFPNEGFGKAAFMRMLMTVDAHNSLRDAPTGATALARAPKCYDVDDPNQFGGVGWRRFFYFGGPGC